MPDQPIDPAAQEEATGPSVTMRDPASGKAYDVPFGQVDTYARMGFRREGADERASRIATETHEDVYGGVGGKIKAGLAGVVRGVTLGGSDVLARAFGGEQAAADLEGYRSENPITSTLTEIGGAAGATLLSAGAATPAGLAARAGRAVTELGAEAGTLGKIGYGALGGAAEGALFGAGQGVSELALSQDPLTVEHVASALSSNALFGAALGGGIGGLGKGAELGLRRAKGAIDAALEKRALSKAQTPIEAIESGDLQHVDKRILDTAERSELERLRDAQAPQREALTEDLDAWRKANRDADDIRTITKSSAKRFGDRNLSEASGAFDRANIKLRNALDDKVEFAADPLRSHKLVRAQGQALEEMLASARTMEQAWRDAVDTAPQRFRADLEAISNKPTIAERTAESRKRGFGGDYTGPFTPAGLDNATERAVKEYSALRYDGVSHHGLAAPSIAGRLPKIEAMLEANQKLQAQLETLAKPPTSDLLTKIAEARAVLEGPKPAPSGLGAVVSAVAPFAGPAGAAAAAGGKVIGSFRKLAAAAGERIGKATSTFLSAAIPATKHAVPLATKTLASLRFGDAVKPAPGAPAKEPKTLPELYQARTREVKEQVHVAPDGTYQMRPDARMNLASKFDGIRATDPKLADQLETKGAARIEYLATIMPRLPDFGVMQIGPDRRQVDDLKMRGWARAAAALEDPHAVIEAAAQGRVTPAAAAAIRAVYPELLNEFTSGVTGQLGSLAKRPHRDKLFALSVLTGVPLDAAMTPGVQRVIQGMYASEPGTQGGTQAPTPQPAFGSVKAAPETQAQMRQGENA